ncbi:DUF3592 domain-containing protein [Saccharibacillus sp. CPCC 101409]|uniref:DUF3592 domain-containing protein n=1 Tax=Saccharibacillus sp. CPCC 101409 TaxID=3058041 RepID=UPI002673B546|nr:DUF3592 domain-containing protein [Saccharibacillus sp. CPCC 101409]MDO3409468.1 DUF3592 domain-containing protein [Saccharibacillus sp. CPCC 101409]
MSVYIGKIFMAAGAILIAVGLLIVVRRIRFMRHAKRVEGEVVDYHEEFRRTGDHAGTLYFPVLRYRMPDGAGEVQSKTGSSWKRRRIGSKVNVYYLPETPEEFKLNTWGTFMLLAVPFMMGLAFLGLGSVLNQVAQ